jgi:CTP synthase
VKPDCVIENRTLPCLYEAPLMLEQSHFSAVVCRELGIQAPEPELKQWRELVERIKSPKSKVQIGLVGKYVQLHDAYLSVAEALRHAGYHLEAEVEIHWIDSETLCQENLDAALSEMDGILVPGGFGDRGIDGMILAAQYAREHGIPYLGICLGMQVAVMEFARHCAGLPDATSGELDSHGTHRVIDLLPGQSETGSKGGTLRLGSYPCVIAPGTVLERAYGQREIRERHRHRYEFNNDYRETLCHAGLVLSGTSPDNKLVEAVELPGHPFFVGVQFHPEFKSRPNRSHPLFRSFVGAALEGRRGGEQNE